MPYATLILCGPEPTPEVRRSLQEKTTEVLVESLGAPHALVAVRVVVDPPGTWAAGGTPLAPDAVGVLARISIAKSSADETQIATAIAALAAMLRNVLGANALPPYVVVERIGDGLWGYKGRTLAQLLRPRSA